MLGLKIKTHRNFNIPQMGQINQPEKTLEMTKEELSRGRSVKWWLSVGTALGLYREGDFISNDTDIDIGIRARSGQEHILFQNNNFIIIRTMEWRGLPIQTAYVDKTNGCIVDLYYYYEDILEKKLVTISDYGWIHYKKPVIVKPDFSIKTLETKYGEYPFLNPIEDYLLDRYGEGWRIPMSVKGKYEDLSVLADYIKSKEK